MTVTLDDVKKAVDELGARVAKLENSRPAKSTVDSELRARVEDLSDKVYGTNLRPALVERADDDMPAVVRLDNLNDADRE